MNTGNNSELTDQKTKLKKSAKKIRCERSAGILLPVYSLPSVYGIGSFSGEAKKFIDFLAASGQKYWQMLPLGPVNGTNSPYQSLSCFAGNPLLIDPDGLFRLGLVSRRDLNNYLYTLNALTLDSDRCKNSSAQESSGGCEKSSVQEGADRVNYPAVRAASSILLHKAHSNFRKILACCPDCRNSSDACRKCEMNASKRGSHDFKSLITKYNDFCAENTYWLPDYALYMSVKSYLGDMPWPDWPEDIRKRWPHALYYYNKKLSVSVSYHKFVQFIFSLQCNDCISYAHKKGIKIIGDMPIYAAYDSADCWAHPEYFEFDENFNPVNISGCPPDAFSPEGQLWGNPLYRWNVLKDHGYDWWTDRVRHSCKTFDLLRLDHMRGFSGYFSIPAGARTAAAGTWKKGPGNDLFTAMGKDLTSRFIAEDLGHLTDDVEELLEETGFPRMKVIQFGFDTDPSNPYIPENFKDDNCVVYTGTHDNDTSRGWFKTLGDNERNFLDTYYKRTVAGKTADKTPADAENVSSSVKPDQPLISDKAPTTEENISGRLIDMAMESCAYICIIPLQDYLNLPGEARTNTPGTITENWEWRMPPDALTGELAGHIKQVTASSGRIVR